MNLARVLEARIYLAASKNMNKTYISACTTCLYTCSIAHKGALRVSRKRGEGEVSITDFKPFIRSKGEGTIACSRMHTHTTHTPAHQGNLRENLGGTGYSLPSRAFLQGALGWGSAGQGHRYARPHAHTRDLTWDPTRRAGPYVDYRILWVCRWNLVNTVWGA